MTDDNKTPCPLCRNLCRDWVKLYYPIEQDPIGRRLVPPRIADNGLLYNCKTCGPFVITSRDGESLLDEEHRNEEDARQLSMLLRERWIHKWPTVWIRFQEDKKYAKLGRGELEDPVECVHMQAHELLDRWPRTVADKLNRTLQNLAELSPKGGDIVRLFKSDLGVCFARAMSEMWYHIDSLQAQGLLGRTDHTRNPEGSMVVLSAKGWARVDELTRGTGSSMNPAFVAMWYGGKNHTDEMDELYNESIAPAATDAGYRVGRVNADEFIDFIMDKVLGDIRLAPFVVADFTGNRGGVYLEAGFARGSGKPVIHTCKEEDFEHAHFDIQQINTIKWKEPGDLREKLYHRIIATQGLGPYKKRET